MEEACEINISIAVEGDTLTLKVTNKNKKYKRLKKQLK